MRIIIVNREDRPRPRLVTPKKGAKGDITDESLRSSCDIVSILKRYAGNLADLRGDIIYGDEASIPKDLQDAFTVVSNASESLKHLPNNPFESIYDALRSIENGSFLDRVVGANKPIIPDNSKKEELKDEKKTDAKEDK